MEAAPAGISHDVVEVSIPTIERISSKLGPKSRKAVVVAFFCYLSALPGDLPVGGGYPRGAQPPHLEPHHGQDRARRAPRHPGRPQRAEGAHRGHQADQGQVRNFTELWS